MEKYNKFKLPPQPDKVEDFINRELEFKRKLQEEAAKKPQMVDDFQKPASKDLKVDKIDKRGDIQQIQTAKDYLAKKEAAKNIVDNDEVYDANAMKKQYMEKAANDGKKLFGRNSPVELDYNQFRKAAAKKLSMGGLIGAGATALGTALLPESAMASVPAQAGLRAMDEGDPMSLIMPGNVGPAEGSLDQRIEQGTLTDEDKLMLRKQALQNLIK